MEFKAKARRGWELIGAAQSRSVPNGWQVKPGAAKTLWGLQGKGICSHRSLGFILPSFFIFYDRERRFFLFSPFFNVVFSSFFNCLSLFLNSIFYFLFEKFSDESIT